MLSFFAARNCVEKLFVAPVDMQRKFNLRKTVEAAYSDELYCCRKSRPNNFLIDYIERFNHSIIKSKYLCVTETFSFEATGRTLVDP